MHIQIIISLCDRYHVNIHKSTQLRLWGAMTSWLRPLFGFTGLTGSRLTNFDKGGLGTCLSLRHCINSQPTHNTTDMILSGETRLDQVSGITYPNAEHHARTHERCISGHYAYSNMWYVSGKLTTVVHVCIGHRFSTTFCGSDKLNDSVDQSPVPRRYWVFLQSGCRASASAHDSSPKTSRTCALEYFAF